MNIYDSIKRIMDFTISALGLILISPLLLLISIGIKTTTKGPVLFKQKRIGKSLSTFYIYKFRTMTDEKHPIMKITGRNEAVTRIGYYLRRYKIDELPQLINVIKGEMSLVGPRPGIPEDLEKMSDQAKKRYLIRPGLTGLAQVSGNIYNSWEKRYEYDLEYIKKRSFKNDIKILLRTIHIIINGEENFVNRPLSI